MSHDEQAIHQLFAAWHQATARGDLPQVLSLMSYYRREPHGGFLAARRRAVLLGHGAALVQHATSIMRAAFLSPI